MPLDYSCDDLGASDPHVLQVVSSLANALQLIGQSQASILQSASAPLNTAAYNAASASQSVATQIAATLHPSAAVIAASQQQIATGVYGTAGQAISQAVSTQYQCCQCTGAESPAAMASGSASPPVPIPSWVATAMQSSSTSVPSGPTNVNVYVPPCPVPYVPGGPVKDCPTKIVVVQKNPAPNPAGGFDKYCTAEGEGQILPTEFGPPPDAGWIHLAHSMDQSGPWPDCPGPSNPQSPQPPTKPPQATGGAPIPPLCGDDDYQGLVATLGETLELAFRAVGQPFVEVLNDASLTAAQKAGRVATLVLASVDFYGERFGCGQGGANRWITIQAVGDMMQKFLGVANPNARAKIQYAINAQCPYIRPGASEALSAYMADTITLPQLINWVETSGHCWQPFSKQLTVARKKIAPDSAIDLWRRDIWSISQVYGNHRQQGFLDHKESDLLIELTKFVPSASDIMRGMVRDVANDTVATHYGLDKDRDDVYTGDLKKWGKYDAVGDDVLKAEWRAHWAWPGVGELLRMYHLLRTDDTPADKRITEYDIQQIVKFGSVAPWYSEKILDTLYNPISRWDLRPANAVGALTSDRAKIQMQRLGFGDVDIATMLDHMEREKKNAIYSTKPVAEWKGELINRQQCEAALAEYGFDVGFITETLDRVGKSSKNHTAVGEYRNGELTYLQATVVLADYGLDPDTISRLLDGIVPTIRFSNALKKLAAFAISPDAAAAELKADGIHDPLADKIVAEQVGTMEAELQKRCVEGIRKRYLSGEFEIGMALATLQGNGIDAQWSFKLTGYWQCERDSIGRQVPTAELCTWFEKGIIGVAEYQQRLKNLGYNQQTAAIIAGRCSQAAAQKQAELNAKALDTAIKAEKAQEKASAAAAQKEAVAAVKKSKADAAAKAAAATLQGNLVKLGAHYATKAGLQPADAVGQVQSLFGELTAGLNLTDNEAAKIVASAIDLVDKKSPLPILGLAMGLLGQPPDATAGG